MSAPGRAGDEFGTLERVGDRSVLRFERRLAHPRELVWRALTEEGELAAWFPTTMEGERRAGAPLTFSFRAGEAEPFAGEMLAFVPPSLLALRWADDVLRFELEPAEDGGPGCVLRLEVTVAEHGKAARDGAGWHVCLDRLCADMADDDTAISAPAPSWRRCTPSTSSISGPRPPPSGRRREWSRPRTEGVSTPLPDVTRQAARGRLTPGHRAPGGIGQP